MKSPEVVVIGAGVVGASIGYHLAKSGVPVTMIDRESPGSRTSKVSFGWINALGKRPKHYHRFSRLSMDAYSALLEDLGPNAGIGSGGGLHWPAPDAQGIADMKRLALELDGLDYPYQLMTPKEAGELEPNFHVDGVQGPMLYAPIERWADGDLLARSLANGAVNHGASVMAQTSVKEIVAQGGKVTGVSTSGGFVAAATVVVAAGTASVGLLAPLGYRLPLDRVVGVLAVVSAPPDLVTRVLYPGQYHVRPTTDGRVAIGCGEMDFFADEDTDASSPPAWADLMLQMAQKDCPRLGSSRVEELRVGARPMPSDELPIIGYLPSIQGAYVATMHSGVSLAPIVGQTVTEEITSGRIPSMLEPYRPERFLKEA